jgi:type I restriction enzyme S subunit
LHYGDIHGATKTFVDVRADYQDIPKLNIHLKQVSSKSMLEDGDVVFVDASEDDEGTSRHVVVVNRDNIPFISGLHTIVAKSKTAELAHEYRRYCFQTSAIRQQFLFYAVGTKVSGISKTNIAKLTMPVPKIPEQRAIAEALSDVDALLGALEHLIAKKRDLKQAAMQQLLTGQTRLPGFHGEWAVKRLGELLDYEQPTKYLVKDSEYSDDNDVPVLTAGKTFILGYTNEKNGIYDDLPAIIFDDFTTAIKYVTFPFKAKSSAMKILKPRDKAINLRLIFEIMQSIEFKLGDHKRYWISEYQHLPIKFPDAKEQTAMAEVLTDMDAELAALEQRRAKTRALKQGMMQELLTGRIRLM